MAKLNLKAFKQLSLDEKIEIARSGQRFLSDKRISKKFKLALVVLVAVVAAVYMLAPIDLIPDAFPVVGQLDDLGVDVGVASYIVKWVKMLGEDKKLDALAALDKKYHARKRPAAG